jgi:hypothetical protein
MKTPVKSNPNWLNLKAVNAPKAETQPKRMLKQEDFRQSDAEVQAERKRKDNQEYNDRLDRLATAKKSENKDVVGDKNWRNNLADKTGAIGDKLRVSNKPNFFDDYVNPAAMVGDMASAIGQAPKQAKESNSVMPYVTSLATPIVTGALAGVGAKAGGSTLKGLARQGNELFNPLAGVSKSSLDWGKWNKEIPLNKPLMKQSVNKKIDQNIIDNYTQREVDWLNSEEAVKRNMAATGKSKEAVIKERDKIFKQVNKTTINTLDDKADMASGVYANNKNNPVINLFNTGNEKQLLNVADHEIKHAVSQQAIRSGDGLTDLITNPYKKYPTVNVKKWYDNFIPGETTSEWSSKAPEQQVVSKRIMDLVEKTQGIKRGTQLTDVNIEKLKEFLNTQIGNKDLQDPDVITMFSSFKSKFGKDYPKQIKDMVNKAYIVPTIVAGKLAKDKYSKDKKPSQ